MTPWELEDGRVIQLLAPAELRELPLNTKLVDIMGENGTVESFMHDDDTRGGHLAYGLPDLREIVTNTRKEN